MRVAGLAAALLLHGAAAFPTSSLRRRDEKEHLRALAADIQMLLGPTDAMVKKPSLPTTLRSRVPTAPRPVSETSGSTELERMEFLGDTDGVPRRYKKAWQCG